MKTILLILLSFINLTFLLNIFNVNAGEIHTSEKAKQITKLIVTSPDEKILNFLKKKYKKKILYHRRYQK